MKSKEAIRKQIIHYANLTWETSNINNLNPLVHLMIEQISNELFLLDNKLDDIDSSVLDKLVKNLSPLGYNYVRPSHTILQIHPASPTYNLGRNVKFVLKELPLAIRNKNISSVAFTPVIDTKLFDVSLTHLFCNKTLWNIHETGKRSVLGFADKRATYNTVWLGLEVGQGIKNLKDLSFYLDFTHLPDHHEYYDMLPEIKWLVNDKPLKMKHGLSVNQDIPVSKVETEVLDFYKDHFQTINSNASLVEFQKEKLPPELINLLNDETTAAIPPLLWVSISFPASFIQDDIEKMTISLNAFPAINRRYNTYEILEQDLESSASLSSGIGQEFLDMETVTDSLYNTYLRTNILNGEGTYTVEPISRKTADNPRIIDYLERMVDIIYEEQTAFPGIDSENIVSVLNSISSIQDKDTHRIELNRLNDHAEVALFTTNPNEDIHSVTISYWTTHANLINGIPEKTNLMASRIPELNKSDAVFLTTTAGGRSFYNQQSLKAINRFYLTSKDRILTKNDILNFCLIELGEYTDNIDVVRKAVISHRYKEGIIIVMEIQITPQPKHVEYLRQKGTFKDLLIRLRKKSPDNFNYRIKLVE